MKKTKVDIQKDKADFFNKFLSKDFFQKPQVQYGLIYALLLFSALLLYGRTYWFNWGLDDEFLYNILDDIKKNGNSVVFILHQKFGEDYRPVTVFFFWLENLIFNDFTPGNAHLINVFIFGLLLTQIFRFILLGEYYKDKKVLLAFSLLVSLMFLIHPMHVCVAANIKSRDNLLSMLFGVLSAIQYLKFVHTRKKIRLVVFLVFIFLANLAKADAYIFILFPFLHSFFYNFKNIKTIVVIVICSYIVFSVYSTFKHDLQHAYIPDKSIITRVYLDSPLYNNNSFMNRLSLSLTTMFYYLKFFILPAGYHAYYGCKEVQLTDLFSAVNILSLLSYLAMGGFCVWKFKSNRIYAYSFLFYLLAIAYASNYPVIVSGILSERYNFIGSLGLCMFLSALIVEFLPLNHWKDIFNIRLVVPALIIICLCIYRMSDWKDTRTLLLRDVKNNTQAAQTYLMLGSGYLNSALFDGLQKDSADAEIKKAALYTDKGLSIDSFNPFLLENKGIVNLYYGNNEQAIYYFKKGYESDSFMISCINYTGIAYRNMNKIDTALYFFGNAMNKTDVFSYAANNYIEMLIRKKQFKSVDSTLNVLTKKCSNDAYLQSKIKYLRETGGWYAF